MNNIAVFEVTATVDTVLKKLARAQIPVHGVTASGAKVRFGVNHEYIQKVFAIFKHSCYNIVIKEKCLTARFACFLKRRCGLIVGGVLAVIAIALSQNIVLQVRVTGNAAYLNQSVITLATECGVKPFTTCSHIDKPLLAAKITAINGVEFCSISRKGWAVVIDVHAKQESQSSANTMPMRANRSGVIKKLTSICGTAQKTVGESVAVDDVLIANYELLPNGTTQKCLAVGVAQIEVVASITLFYQEETSQNEKLALAATQLYCQTTTQKTLKVTPCDGGYYYQVDFTYLYTQAWNMD